jgi:serine/threonine-protein kinase
VSPPTEVAGRYLIERRLGAGGMSTVFMAKDTVLERPVAVKLLAEHLADDEAFVYRFRREALSAARLQHPNIVQVFDSGQDPSTERHYIVMEYVDGPSAADMLRERKELDIDETVRLVRDACHGLDYAHRAGVVHRDVKPGNLLFAEEMGATKLADFGIAKAAEQTRITQVGSVLGTAAYLSPEQARGEEAGPASDIYSLGVCAYQFLTGRLPHEYASLTELALKQQQDPVAPIADYRPDVPPELDDAVRLALERDPAARYSSALEMAEAIEAGARGEATAATQRLAITDYDATRAMDDTSATQALPRTQYRGPQPTRVQQTAPPLAAAPARDRRDDRAAARRAASRRRFGSFLALLAAIAAIVVVAAALLSSSDGNRVQPVDTGDPQQQIDGLRDFIREHSQR